MASITGQLINDANGSGSDENESPVNDHVLQLIDEDNKVVASSTTADVDLNENGSIDPATERGVFRFDGIAPGEYQLQIAGGDALLTFASPAFTIEISDDADAVTDVDLGVHTNEPLTQDALDAIVAAALARWADSGISATAQTQLSELNFVIADLTDSITMRSGQDVVVDSTIPSIGWFVDTTADDDREFGVYDRPGRLLGSRVVPENRFDLLSFVNENMRMELASETSSLDADSIPAGVRLLPTGVEPMWWSDATIVYQETFGWFDGQWNYRRPITIENTSAVPLVNHQAEIRLDSSAFDFAFAQTNGEDVRFTDSDGVTLLSHWREQFDQAGESAWFMVDAPTLQPGEQRTLYVYYGNPEAEDASDWPSVYPTLGAALAPQRAPIADETVYDGFPAMKRLANGDLLMAFRGGLEHAGPAGSIMLSRSTDGGETWTTTTIFDEPDVDDRVHVGLAQLSNGVLILPIVQYGDVNKTFTLRSTDNGFTWSAPLPVNHHYNHWLFPYGKIIERPEGVIEMPVYGEYQNGRREIAILESSNQGDSWSLKSIVDSRASGSGFGEMAIAAVSGSQYIAVYRDADQIFQRDSSDGGYTWGPERRLFDGVSPDLLNFGDGQLMLCVGDRLDVEGIRCHFSDDGGETWSEGAMIATSYYGQFLDGGYPATIELADGSLMTSFYYRSAGDLNIDRVRFSREFVQQGPFPTVEYQLSDFDPVDLNGWEILGDVEFTESAARRGSGGMRLTDESSSRWTKATRELYPFDQGRGGVSFWANLDSSSPQGVGFRLGDSGVSGAFNSLDDNSVSTYTSRPIFQLDFTADGSVRYYDASGPNELPIETDLSLDTWHKFTINFDTNRQEAELLINGESRGVFDAFQESNGIRYLAFTSWDASSQGDTVLIDDIYTQSPRNQGIVTLPPEGTNRQHQGELLTITASDTADRLVFEAGAEQHRLRMHGQTYAFSRGLADTIEIKGDDGIDSLEFQGLPEVETVMLAPGGGFIRGDGYRLSLSEIETIIVEGNGGDDVADFGGSSGADQFWARPAYSYMQGPGYVNEVRGFPTVIAHAAGSGDLARLFGSSEREVFIADRHGASLTGEDFAYHAHGFERVLADSRGGDDRAEFYGTQWKELFVGRRAYSYLQGDRFLIQANGFPTVVADARQDIGDEAKLYDSPLDDLFISRPDYSFVQGDGFINEARGFSDVRAFASTGEDVARFFGSEGQDEFIGRSAYSYLAGPGFLNQGFGFDVYYAHGREGVDQARLYDSEGNDRYVTREAYSYLDGPGFMYQVDGFERVSGYSRSGDDRAWIYDTPRDDMFIGRPTTSYVAFDNQIREAFGFGKVTGVANQGGDDVAKLFASPGADLFVGRPAYSFLQGPGFTTQVNQFELVQGLLGGPGDEARFYGSTADDEFIAAPDSAELRGPSYHYRAATFPLVNAFGGGALTVDTAILLGSRGDDRFVSRTTYDYLLGANFVRQANGFQENLAFAIAGNDRAEFYEAMTGDTLLGDRSSVSLLRDGKVSHAYEIDAALGAALAGETGNYSELAIDYVLRRVGDWTAI